MKFPARCWLVNVTSGSVQIFEERLRIVSVAIQDAALSCLHRSLGKVFSGTQLTWNGGVAISAVALSASSAAADDSGEPDRVAQLRGILLEDNLNHLSVTGCPLQKVS